MRDMFDEFMEELRRRQAEQRRGAQGDKSGDSGDAGSAPAEDEAEDETARDETTRDEEPAGGDDRDEGRDERRFGSDRYRRAGGPPRRPRPVGEQMGPQGFGRGTVIIVAIFIVLGLILAFLGAGVGLWTDAIWYGSVGFASVFWTRIWSQVGFFVLGTLIALVLLAPNVWLAGRFVPPGPRRRFSLDDLFERFSVERNFQGMPYRPRAVGGDSIEVPNLDRPIAIGLLAVAALVSLMLGGLLASNWEMIQLWMHQVPFGRNDPVFGIDIGFYLFQLPFLRLVQSFINTLLLVGFILAGVRYLIAILSGASLSTAARVHVGLLLGLYLVSIAAGLQLDKLELLQGNNGVVTGVSYTDANARFLAINVLTVLAVLAGAFIIGFAYTRWLLPLWVTIGVWIVAAILLEGAYPLVVQRFAVDPNQQTLESPYIANNIAMTRLAFGLDKWTHTAYQPTSSITSTSLAAEQSTLMNARLWDYTPLQKTLDQLQIIRQYYTFKDLDTDRYTFNDPSICNPAPTPCLRQVWVGGRELDYGNLDPSWVNQHLTYTHGIGAAMVPVNDVVAGGSGGGQPRLIIQNLPPVSNSGAPLIKVPQIYFGTEAENYVIVRGAGQEFDYPASSNGASDTYTTWSGETGIHLDNALIRLLFAANLGDLNLFISNQITGSSQLLIHQQISDRIPLIAPFLRYDKDPYLVVTKDGRLVYILDAYTTTDRFPNAEAYNPGGDQHLSGLAGEPFDYVRNSVKIVMDAYDGSMSFYVADSTDPLIKAWQGVFPGLFRPIDDMPADIRAHIRYPEDLFNAQTTMYERYHITDPGVLYQGNDTWQVPNTADSTNAGNTPDQLGLEAYYVVMRLPGQVESAKPEFLLLQPMVPKDRPNMIAWVGARNDGANYGQISTFDFPRDSTIFGPSQMEGLFAQNKDISPQITLWSQQGSKVVLGNLLVIPIQNSILYIEPVYLQSTNNPLPVFQKVIVATPTQIVWGDTLQDAINQILSGKGSAIPGTSPAPSGPGSSPGPSASPGASATSGPSVTPIPGVSLPPNATVQQILAQASQHYDAAQAALRAGDLAGYQREIDIVGQLLRQAQGSAGTPAP